MISLGNAQARPDLEAMEVLGHSKLVLIALDADEAGAKEAWGWWLNHFAQAKRWPPIEGKDPGDMVGRRQPPPATVRFSVQSLA